ncbi:MAG: quinolinate synthase [Candidatus Omnitrophota bacterium]|jgi:quinolinate synthase|nr:MAG: quinolinate synthase [Candidatus Omnitrophota bacterium]
MSAQLEQIEQTLQSQPDQHLEFLAKKDIIARILELREEKNVLILGHNYMEPLVYQLSGEKERGDSLALSRYAAQSDKPIILFDGVMFMAETAKILSPDKKVLIADATAGCSLAEPFKAKDVLEYRRRFPHAPVVTYVNSYADIKAESDYCCTSANGLDVVLHASKTFNSNQVIFFPDSLMGANLQHDVEKQGIDLIYPGKYDENFGRCEVHEQFKVEHLRDIRLQYDIPKHSEEAAILVHWECRPEVIAEADYYGSTSQMAKYIADHPHLKRVFLATECEMAANLASEYPHVEFVRSCNLFCQHMRKITLEKILYSLEHEVYEVNVDEEIAERARKAIDRMLEIW